MYYYEFTIPDLADQPDWETCRGAALTWVQGTDGYWAAVAASRRDFARANEMLARIDGHRLDSAYAQYLFTKADELAFWATQWPSDVCSACGNDVPSYRLIR